MMLPGRRPVGQDPAAGCGHLPGVGIDGHPDGCSGGICRAAVLCAAGAYRDRVSLDDRAVALAAEFGQHRNGILITLKRDGRPQASVVAHAYDHDARTVRVSVTDDRAKTRNVRRDPRVSYMVTRPGYGGYVVGEGLAELTPVAADPADATVDALVSVYRAVSGEHPDWDEFRAAMVADRRLMLSLRLDHVYGWTS